MSNVRVELNWEFIQNVNENSVSKSMWLIILAGAGVLSISISMRVTRVSYSYSYTTDRSQPARTRRCRTKLSLSHTTVPSCPVCPPALWPMHIALDTQAARRSCSCTEEKELLSDDCDHSLETKKRASAGPSRLPSRLLAEGVWDLSDLTQLSLSQKRARSGDKRAARRSSWLSPPRKPRVAHVARTSSRGTRCIYTLSCSVS